MKQKKIISLPTNSRKIYRQILAFMNFMLNLTPQERDVLAEFIRLNNEFEALPTDKRIKFILSTDTRKEICTLTKMEAKQFNVVLSRLKKKRFGTRLIIDDAEGIHPDLQFKLGEDGFQFEVNFILTSPTTPVEAKNNHAREVVDNYDRFVNEKPQIGSDNSHWTHPTPENTEIVSSPPVPPVEYQHDAAKAPVIEEEDFDIQITNPL
jgi:hypothetical protein